MLPPSSQSRMPWQEGIVPVRMEARAGEQTGEAQKKLSNFTPLWASLSRLGVWMSVFPAFFMAQCPMSSASRNRMFGCFIVCYVLS